MTDSKSVVTARNIFCFLFFSGLGIFLFFVPIVMFGKSSKVPMVHIIDLIKGSLGGNLNYIVFLLVVVLGVAYTHTIVSKKQDTALSRFFAEDGIFTGILYYLAVIFAIVIISKKGPALILDPEVGGLAISLAGGVLLTVTIAGWLIVLIMEFGMLEFLGTLIEPIMRVLFKLPGRSSVDALASFVSAPAVGVYITNKLYTDNKYTAKEACCITTNFSVCSLGFFALLVSIGKIEEYFPHTVITSLIVVFIMAMIVIRIPPISLKKDIYFNGTIQTEEERRSERYNRHIFKKAFHEALQKVDTVDMKILYLGIVDAFLFAIKIVAYVLSIAVISLILANYTPVFEWLGKPMIPFLKMLGLANATEIAPATLVGIAEIALPVLIIAGKSVAPASIFFVVVLSTVQIIFFTESANAMLKSNMPLNFGELLVIFLIRTIIAIPLVAVATKMIF